MPTLSATQTLQEADNFANDFSSGLLTIREGSTILASHSIQSWTTTNVGEDATASPTFANLGIANIVNTGTPNSVLITQGSRSVEVFDSVTLGSTDFQSGNLHTITSAVFNFPAE